MRGKMREAVVGAKREGRDKVLCVRTPVSHHLVKHDHTMTKVKVRTYISWRGRGSFVY